MRTVSSLLTVRCCTGRCSTGRRGPADSVVNAKSPATFYQQDCNATPPSNQRCAAQADPPLAKGAPPVAGGIQWARGLLAKVQRTMHTLQTHHATLLEASFGQMVRHAWCLA